MKSTYSLYLLVLKVEEIIYQWKYNKYRNIQTLEIKEQQK
jgi:hypothetical protein